MLYRFRQFVKRQFGRLASAVRDRRYYARHRHLAGQRKIVYALTPHPGLSNVGDHAQAVAILAWLDKHFSPLPVLEIHKTDVLDRIAAIRRLVAPGDVIFLHSGGNLGDRGHLTEDGRRLMISSFPDNRVISLPQTIFFSDTPHGRKVRDESAAIYSAHPDLTVIGRDPRSAELAAELFPKAASFAAPDFVLSLPPHPAPRTAEPPRILLCLRLDNESALTAAQRQALADAIPFACDLYDTERADPIDLADRDRVVEDTLALFGRYNAVVTDRYHGLIFSVLCELPTVVLATVDHKLTSAISWFQDVPFVQMAERLEDVPDLVQQMARRETGPAPRWSEKYFDPMVDRLGLRDRSARGAAEGANP